jgi:hypothetical protein
MHSLGLGKITVHRLEAQNLAEVMDTFFPYSEWYLKARKSLCCIITESMPMIKIGCIVFD